MKNKKTSSIDKVFHTKDRLWFFVWILGIALLLLWDLVYLNKPAMANVLEGTFNTFLIAVAVVITVLILSIIFINLHFQFERRQWQILRSLFSFIIDLLRSIPQIVGILLGFVFISGLLYRGQISPNFAVILSASVISIFVFQEMIDLMQERIDFFKKLDFYQAMTVCGVSSKRILNYHILWKNSRRHIFNKMVAIFGMAIFLQCSVDFIISVGLSTDISPVDLPVTLGNLLAHIDSKQDILAIGHTLTHPSYISNLFLKHLQGLSVAFIIVFSLLSVYKISNGLAERYRL